MAITPFIPSLFSLLSSLFSLLSSLFSLLSSSVFCFVFVVITNTICIFLFLCYSSIEFFLIYSDFTICINVYSRSML
ncbi:hypothetical protein Lalb_Chr12g0197491 [Lupinus albus]|uniref:Uncharacterized protein n=1 Tax=Lupinus albus TaxID=3870 RepID=A0A6A4PL36_LUPAL|nr:hypothetical protein Lalb_Chr12g0197491 [Lupinus albus]